MSTKFFWAITNSYKISRNSFLIMYFPGPLGRHPPCGSTWHCTAPSGRSSATACQYAAIPRLQSFVQKQGIWQSSQFRRRGSKLVFVKRDMGQDSSIATLPPFGSKAGHKWLFQVSSQWESQKNQFAFISFGKIQFYLPAFEISRSCRTSSGDLTELAV